MRALTLLLFVVVVGCGTGPLVQEDECVETPRSCWTRDALPPGEAIESRAYAYEGELEAGHGLEKLLRVALPDGAWGEASSVAVEHGSLGIVQTKSAHERIARVMSAIASSRRDSGFTVNVYDVPLETASNLGPLEVARGARDLNAFLRVPLTEEAVARLDRLAREGKIERLSAGAAAGPAGAWIRFRDQNVRLATRGLAFTGQSFTAENAVGTTGVVFEAATVPLREDGSVLMVFEAEDAIELGSASLVAGAGHGLTRVPVELPAWICRKAVDAVSLRAQESLALVGSATEGRVHLIVISPFYRL